MPGKIALLLLSIVLTGIMSCSDSEEIAGDQEAVLANTFQIRIYSHSGTTTDQTIDLALLNNYSDFKNVVEGCGLKKITYQMKNDNVPSDMYFSGRIICKDEAGEQEFVAASMPRVNISATASAGHENELVTDRENFNKVLGWLKDPGIFRICSGYELTDESNAYYPITPAVSGSNFEIIIRIYIQVQAGV
jgi:hypothetical protein